MLPGSRNNKAGTEAYANFLSRNTGKTTAKKNEAPQSQPAAPKPKSAQSQPAGQIRTAEPRKGGFNWEGFCKMLGGGGRYW